MHIAATSQNAPPPTTTVAPFSGERPLLNDPSLTIRGGQVWLEALLDYEGLEQLEEQIKALKTLLKRKRSANPAESAEKEKSVGPPPSAVHARPVIDFDDEPRDEAAD